MKRSDSSLDPEREIARGELKSTPFCLSTLSVTLPSFTSWVCIVAPSRTVKSVGRRIEMLSPFSYPLAEFLNSSS